MPTSRTADTGGSARPRWSVSARRRRGPRCPHSASRSARLRRFVVKVGGRATPPHIPQPSGVVGEPAASVGHVLVGVDVGGTTIAAGGVTPEGDVLHDETVLTHDAAAAGTLVTIERLITTVSAALASRGLTVSGIGVGAPGPVDVEAGRVGEPAPHARDLVGQPTRARPTTRVRVPVAVDNDVNALALAEWRVRAR